MTRAIAINWYAGNGGFWDFVYQAVLVGLGIAATVAVYIQINGL